MPYLKNSINFILTKVNPKKVIKIVTQKQYIRIRISVLQVDRTIFEGVIGHFEYFIKKYLGGGEIVVFVSQF
jgi:hypothetical protein